MKFTSLIVTGVFLATTTAAMAANPSDTSNIRIEVTKGKHVKLIGTAIGQTKTFTTDVLSNNTVSLGTLGLESNSKGKCDVAFSSKNGFKLSSAVTNKNLGTYSILHEGAIHSFNRPNSKELECNTVASNLRLRSPTIQSNIAAGVYSDVLTITVTTQ
jgi:hypothetical protein